jgi:CSLREA domain-containing protein
MNRRFTSRATLVATVCLIVVAPARADTFVVTNTADPGNGTCDAGCTLREAIDAANANPGVDFIHFDIPGAGPHTIHPLTPLPDITETVSIDGSTQPGFAGTPVIEIAGDLAGVDADGLWIAGNSSQIGWLAINRFDRAGIYLVGGGSGGALIVGCHLGVDPTGAVALPNRFGVASNGGSNNQIGGTSPSHRNIISGNTSWGITMVGTEDTVIEGNYIGLDRSGTVAIPNGYFYGNGGVNVNVATHNNRVGGAGPGAGNVISGNFGVGVYLNEAMNPPPANNVVEGNLIGSDASGTVAVPNQRGVWVSSPFNTIGGSALGAGNTIVGNTDTGLLITGGADGTIAQGNWIGVNQAGDSLGNLRGIRLLTPEDCLIGGTGPGEANTIAFNTQNGVLATGGLRNEISANSIHSNGGLGIDLDDDGVTPNDPLDADTGPNDLQNCPTIVAAERTVDGTQLVVYVDVDSKASQWYEVQYFANDACDPSGSGEGRTYLGTGPALTDASGHYSGIHTLTTSVGLDQLITATATDSLTRDTSEFSPCVAVTSAACGLGAGSCYVENGTIGCLNDDCCDLVCDIDAYCCQTTWDPLCVQEALDLCGNCGAQTAGACHWSNGSPGCYEGDCCETICVLDDYCCDMSWDALCAEQARATCTLACRADCAVPADGTIDVTDLLKVLADWGSPGACDIDESGAIDVTDLLAVLADWGPCL